VDSLDVPFTVLIPTRNRSRTLKHTIQSCLNQQSSNLRVIVSDNFSTDETVDVVRGFNDPRLEYINPGRRLSMSGNFEFSLDHVKKSYVMHLGDDDALLPFAIDTVQSIIKETGAAAITTSQATYYWPDVPDKMLANRLTYLTQEGYEIRSASEAIHRVIRFKSPYSELPSTYSSFVHTDIIDRARRNGRYFASRTPDSYSGFVNASLLADYVYCHTPFSLAGISSRSNGASQLGGRNPDEAKLYEIESDLPFHERLVYAPSIEIIVAEAFLQAKKHASSMQGIDIDIELICKIALREAQPWNIDEVALAIKEIRERNPSSRNTINGRGLLLSSPLRNIMKESSRIMRGITRIMNGLQFIDCTDFGVTTIEDASWLAHYRLKSAHTGYDRPFANLKQWMARI
jgi:Glycosyl transferase family 2